MKQNKLFFAVLALLLMVSGCKKQPAPYITFSIDPTSIAFDKVGGSRVVLVNTNGDWTATNTASWLSMTAVSGSGVTPVTLKTASNDDAARQTTVEFKCNGKTLTLAVSQDGKAPGPVPGDLPHDARKGLAKAIGSDIIHSMGTLLYKKNNIMQGFDFTDSQHYYYSQSPDGVNQYISMCAGPGKGYSSFMTLEKFGHMTQIVSEAAADGKTYIWCNSNGIMTSDTKCDENLSFSRIEYKAGGSYKGGYGGETFFLTKAYGGKPHMDLQVSVDFEHRRLLVGTRVSGVAIRFFWVYDLDQAYALPLKDIKVTINGEQRTVNGRELADLKELGYFELPRGTSPSQEYYYSHQGHEVQGDYIWFYEGSVSSDSSGKNTSVAYVTVHDYNGKVIIPRTEVKAISDNAAMASTGFSADGYAEGESIKVKGDKLYLGMACHNSSNNRIQNILVYDLE